MMRREPERTASKSRSSAARSPPPADLPAEAAPVFERLRAWRAAAAKEQGVPAYVIFHDATLRQIATDRPTTLRGARHHQRRRREQTRQVRRRSPGSPRRRLSAEFVR